MHSSMHDLVLKKMPKEKKKRQLQTSTFSIISQRHFIRQCFLGLVLSKKYVSISIAKPKRMRQSNFMLTWPKASNTNLVELSGFHLRACCKHTQEGDGKKKVLFQPRLLFSPKVPRQLGQYT